MAGRLAAARSRRDDGDQLVNVLDAPLWALHRLPSQAHMNPAGMLPTRGVFMHILPLPHVLHVAIADG
jgi:hypothetical protein